MARLLYWPPPKGPVSKFNCPWKECIATETPDGTIALNYTPSVGKDTVQHHARLLFSITESTPWKEGAPVIPFIQYPVSNCGKFKGCGTNNLETAKRFYMVQVAEFFWDLARNSKFGEEGMIRYSALCLRALSTANFYQPPSEFNESTLQPFSDIYFKDCIRSVCEFARFQKMPRPPESEKEGDMLKSIKCLCYCIDILSKNVAPLYSYVKWSSTLTKIMKSSLLFIIGVYLFKVERYPFENQTGYETVSKMAERLDDSQQCLIASAHPNSPHYLESVSSLLNAGYKHNVRERISYKDKVLSDSFLNSNAEGIVFSKLSEGDDATVRILSAIGADKQYLF